MSKIYKTKIKHASYGLKMLTLLAFVFIFMPLNKTLAEGGANYIYTSPQVSYYNVPTQYPVYVPPQQTQVVYLPNPNQNVSSNTTTVRRTVTVARAPAKKIAYYLPVEEGTPGAVSSLPAGAVVKDNANTDTTSSLAANAFYGSNSFLPSGIIQWILFAIFILIIVILVRRVFGHKEKYLASPLKHD